MGASMGRVFGGGQPSSTQEMQWTGMTPAQTAEDLRKWGYSEDEIARLTRSAKPSLGQRFAQGAAWPEERPQVSRKQRARGSRAAAIRRTSRRWNPSTGLGRPALEAARP